MPSDEATMIAQLAERQHGLVTRAQLLRAGLKPRTLDRRVAAKRLRLVQRGIYQVGPIALPRAREMAAVLAGGGASYVSHGSAAALWGLLPPDATAPVHVTVVGRDRPRRPGVVAHRVARLERSAVTRVDGIPVTAPARTLFDLAAVARGRELEQAFAEALERRLVARGKLLALAPSHAGRRGVGTFRKLLEDETGPLLLRSEAEEQFLALIKKARLPGPAANTYVGPHRVDFVWRAERLVVEVDGYAFHSTVRRFEGDRWRDADLAALGYRVTRVTWRQIVHEPEAMLVRLAGVLAKSEAR